MSWLDHNRVLTRSVKNGNIDGITYRDLKLKSCLKRLIIDGDQIDVNDGVVDSLPAQLVGMLVSLFEKYVEPSEDDLKKLETTAYAFLKGQSISGLIPQHIYEHLIASHYKWPLNDIRDMSNYDFQAHLRVCLVRERIDSEFKVALAGKSGKGGKGGYVNKKFDPLKGDFV